jgi:hypothetical protein
MFTGKRFVLKKACTGIDITDFETRKTMLIPAGDVIEIKRGPVPGGCLVEVSWKGNACLMFGEDIQKNGEPLRNQAAD